MMFLFLNFTDQGLTGNVEDDSLIDIKITESFWIRWMNFGPTFSSRSRTVNDIFRQQLPISIQLGLIALFIAMIIWAFL